MYVNGKAVTRADWVNYLITRTIFRAFGYTAFTLLVCALTYGRGLS